MSKILQNISNNVVTNSKEIYMQKMNKFVLESVPKVQKFFSTIVVCIIKTKLLLTNN